MLAPAHIASLPRALGSLLRGALDLLWPRSCPGCAAPALEGAYCAGCASWVAEALAAPACRACGSRLGPDALTDLSCGGCHGRADIFGPGGVLARVVASGPHDGPLRAAIHALKYSGRQELGAPLGAALAQAVTAAGLAPGVVVPVPLDPARQAERGYNQATLVAAAVAHVLRIPLQERALRRRTELAPREGSQVLRGRRRREEAVRGAFSLTDAGRRALAGRRVLLVDDVLTTGATLAACARAVREGTSPAEVLGACVAHREGEWRSRAELAEEEAALAGPPGREAPEGAGG